MGPVLFILFVSLSVILPGSMITGLLCAREREVCPRDLLGAAAVAAGTALFFLIWPALRWAGIGHGSVALFSALISAVLMYIVSRDPAARSLSLSALRSVFSAESAAFLSLAAVFSAYLTHDAAALYHSDELLRMAVAAASMREFPAQNIFVHSGLMHYYYAAEFLAGSASAITRIPLETVYLRYLVPFNWFCLFLGMRAILSLFRPGYWRLAPYLAFLAFFLVHPKMLFNFAFRQNSFALGLAAAAMPLLVFSASRGLVPGLAVSALMPALITLSKGTFGALYLVFFVSYLSLFPGRRARVIFTLAAGAALWLLAYLSLSGQGFNAGGLIKFGPVPGWLREFLPDYTLSPRLLAYFSEWSGIPGRLLSALPAVIENLATFLILAALPLIALSFWARGAVKEGGRISEEGRVVLSTAAVMAAACVIFVLFHYYNHVGAHGYWVFFSAWLCGAAALPFFFSDLKPVLTPRSVPVFLAAPLADLAVSTLDRYGAFTAWPGRDWCVRGAIAGGTLFIWSAWRWASRSRDEKKPADDGGARRRSLEVFLSGFLLFAAVYCLLRRGAAANLLLYASWIPALASYPLLRVFGPPAFRLGGWRVLAAIPFVVALSHAPKFVYWASGAKRANLEPWTDDNRRACEVMERATGGGGLYLHNVLDRTVFAQAALCGGRMYASVYSDWVWESEPLYSGAAAEADAFFSGSMPDPCGWLAARGIGHVYWDSNGRSYGFPGAAEPGCLSRVYSGGNVALYEFDGP
ncbi:MAG: hypothetical protein RDU13_04160 [Elusimicrobiales bacterium]|jgi:hypothetical protein|nr:hypothetical protein [Elusimicrobiales bacterium]